MSYSIATLLTRNLSRSLSVKTTPGAPARGRSRALHRRWRVLRPQQGESIRGRDEIDRIAQRAKIRATHLDFRYQPIAEPEETGDSGRVRWVAGRPGEAPAYAGTDFIIARDGRIAALYLFFDKLP